MTTLIEALALKLHDTYGCRISCRGGRLADDRHPSHMEAYREPATDILRDPAFREALTAALAEAMTAEQGDWSEPWNLNDPSLPPAIIARMLPEADHD